MPETPSPADPVAAALATIRERAAATKASAHGYVPRGEQLPGGPAGEWVIANLAAAADVPRLLAGVDAVLKRHVQVPAVRLVPCAEHEHWRGPLVGDNDNLAVRRACPRCQVFDEPYCGSCVDDEGCFQDWPCAERRAISRALLGEEGSDHG